VNFFEQQDIARRNSRLLVLLFLIAVFLLIVLTNLAVAAFLFIAQDYNVYSGSRQGLAGFWSFFSWERFGMIGLAVTATVALVVLFRWIKLSTGGKVIAESMGGERILPQTDDKAERRCLNVVEEMALAANMPVPAVYVLNGERGINAFAAGITPADAVVAVTRGTITQLKRNELQGVIAHEFSHILNGDMRLNIRLAAMLKGITFIGDVGHILLRSGRRARTGASSNKKGDSPLPLLGLALVILGWLGELAAGFIKAAISRQKEYLADAGAVQFTRDAEGIGNALKVIGGYLPGTLVHAARAVEMSHIFFGQIEHHIWSLFATHPPLENRIQRLDPDWDGNFIERKPRPTAVESPRTSAEAGVGRAAIVAAAMATGADRELELELSDADFGPTPDELEEETAHREEIPVGLVRHSHDPLGAQAIICSLLISAESDVREIQLALVQESGVRGLVDLTHTLEAGVRQLGAPRRLPLLEMCLPALKAISAPQYRRFKDTLLHLIQADQRTELHEWCLFQLVRHYLDTEFYQFKPSRPRYRRLGAVAPQLQVVLSVLAHDNSSETLPVFQCGAAELGLLTLQPLAPEEASVSAFSKAVHELADCYPLLKPRILKAMAAAASVDGHLSATEKEVVASMAAVMDCPLPDWTIETSS